VEAACQCAQGPPLKARAALALCLAACAPAAANTAPPLTAAAPAPQPRSASELQGMWVEYWAVSGELDTQRYVFFEDGNFSWIAPRNFNGRTAMRKLGRYQLEGNALVLQVSTEEFAACATCGAAGDAKRVEHANPLVERYELGDCAPNVEAQAIDQHYACMAIDGRAFWRRPLPAADAPR
jgi:hypothetical protein